MFKLGRESLGMRERNGEAGIPRGFDTPPAATALASTTISPYAAGMTLKGPDPERERERRRGLIQVSRRMRSVVRAGEHSRRSLSRRYRRGATFGDVSIAAIPCAMSAVIYSLSRSRSERAVKNIERDIQFNSLLVTAGLLIKLIRCTSAFRVWPRVGQRLLVLEDSTRPRPSGHHQRSLPRLV